MAKGPQLLLRAGSRAARGSIPRGGIPNRRKEWVNFYSVHTILIENDARRTRQKTKSRIVMAKADSFHQKLDLNLRKKLVKCYT
jgi:hypothetical protein